MNVTVISMESEKFSPRKKKYFSFSLVDLGSGNWINSLEDETVSVNELNPEVFSRRVMLAPNVLLLLVIILIVIVVVTMLE